MVIVGQTGKGERSALVFSTSLIDKYLSSLAGYKVDIFGFFGDDLQYVVGGIPYRFDLNRLFLPDA